MAACSGKMNKKDKEEEPKKEEKKEEVKTPCPLKENEENVATFGMG